MKPRRPKHLKHQPRIPELESYFKDDDYFWLLFHYGRSYYFKSKNRIYKECYFKKVRKEKPYHIESWEEKTRFRRVSIPETRTFYFPLGSLFDNKGKIKFSPELNPKKKLFPMPGVKISSVNDYYDTGFYSHLNSSSYPIWKKGNDMVYSKAPYYFVNHDYFGLKKVIIPMHIILDYFYYFSPMCIYDILYRNIQFGIGHKDMSVSPPMVPYKSNFIRELEVKQFSKYLFTTNAHYSYKYLCHLSDDFNRKLINTSSEINRHYIATRIPFDFTCSYNFFGIYIDDFKDKPQRFLVLGLSDKPTPLGNNKFWTTNNFDIKDLRDTRSLKGNGSDRNKIPYTAVVVNSSGSIKEELGEEPINVNLGINDDLVRGKRNRFTDTPIITKRDKEYQDNSYHLNSTVIKQVGGLSNNYENHFSQSTSQGHNEVNIFDFDEFFEITNEAMSILKNNDFIVQNVLLGDSQGIYSIPPVMHVEVDRLLIYQIRRANCNYCLIDPGYGKHIGLFRYDNKSIGFKEKSDPKLRDIVIDLSINENFNFYRVRKIKKYLGITFLESLKHLHKKYQKEGLNKAAKDLAERIVLKIQKDV